MVNKKRTVIMWHRVASGTAAVTSLSFVHISLAWHVQRQLLKFKVDQPCKDVYLQPRTCFTFPALFSECVPFVSAAYENKSPRAYLRQQRSTHSDWACQQIHYLLEHSQCWVSLIQRAISSDCGYLGLLFVSKNVTSSLTRGSSNTCHVESIVGD